MKKILHVLLLIQGGLIMAQTKTLVTMYGEKVQYNPNPIVNANNGLTAASGNVQLGGSLTIPSTVITASPTNTLAIVGLQSGVGTDNFMMVSSGGILKTLAPTALPMWGLKGNGSTVAGTNFLGTTDDVDLIFKRKSIQAGQLGATNTAFGVDAFSGAIGGASQNVAIGVGALKNAYGSYNNVAVGYSALPAINGGAHNLAIGGASLMSNTSGNHNVSVGSATMYYNSTGGYNTIVGNASLQYCTTGASFNASLGHSVLTQLLTGNFNLAAGYMAGNALTTGSNNIILGSHAGASYFAVMDNSIILGAKARVNGNNETNEIVIGYGAVGRGSNTVTIGDSTIGSIGGYQPWSNVSDVRLKKDINDSVFGLNFITKLRPVTYFMQSGPTDLKTGFIAQEVETVANSIDYQFSGVVKPQSKDGYYSLSYAEFVVPLVKAVQEQQAEIESQNSKINELQQEVRNMKKILDELLKKG
ncbi:tail fiber domain-containing protein [Flavobacterium procerum]|uniref:Tail fiber domain-containing protein n=1 Tax=Flavobacterium procerum TaxID=1455569 RepID=A0ABV6BRP5_9FLAO